MKKSITDYFIDYIWIIAIFIFSSSLSTIFALLLYVKEHRCSLSIKGFEITVNDISYNLGNAFNVPNSHIAFTLTGVLTLLGIFILRNTNKNRRYFYETEIITLKKVAFGLGIGIVFYLIGYVITALFPNISNSASIDYSNLSFIQIGLIGISMALFAPIYEEIIFRNVFLRALKNIIPVNLAIVVTAFSWAAIHMQYSFSILVYIFIMGLILGKIRVKYNTMFVPILIHITNNFLSVIFG